MKLEIKIEEDIFQQFSSQLKSKVELNLIELEPELGTGKIQKTNFPNFLEFFHFSFTLKNEVDLVSSNPPDSDYYLLNINLSDKEIEKKINGQEINFQKYLPSGILFYPANIKMASKSPPDTNFEIVLIKFHKGLISTYFSGEEANFKNMQGTIVYEDLEVSAEKLLQEIIRTKNKIKSHSKLLAFLSIFFDKVNKRDKDLKYENLHPEDVKQLFIAAALLRNPTSLQVPTVAELAKVAKMGKTKFKNTFKQVFGNSPKQYHQKIKMEYAKDLLINQQKNPTEIAYDLGYAHPSKFTRAFKNYFGELPSKLK